MKYKNLNIDSPPKYSREFNQDTNDYRVKMVAKINGKTISVEAVGKTKGSAYSSAMKRFGLATMSDSERASAFQTKHDLWRVLGAPQEDTPANLSARSQEEQPSSSSRESSRAPDINPNLGGDSDTSTPGATAKKQQGKKQEKKHPMIKGVPRSHLSYISGEWSPGDPKSPIYRDGNDGRGNSILSEPVPKLILRPGEALLSAQKIDKEAVNNNAQIVFGRNWSEDPGQRLSRRSEEKSSGTRYSDEMGSGRIDIVVGAGAPFPLEREVLPSFNTHYPEDLVGVKLTGGQHPGMYMDAARINISQMCTPDYDFKINTSVSMEGSVPDSEASTKLFPCSAVVAKADKVRLISRQDIKIVTGGPHEKYNSHGNRIKKNNGIHLIAEHGRNKEGKPLPQHPMVLGDNLVTALTKMISLMSELGGILDNVTQAQMNFNKHIAGHFHIQPWLLPTAPDFTLIYQGVLTMMDQLLNGRLAYYLNDLNRGNYVTKYLSPMGGSNYILSRHNTVN